MPQAIPEPTASPPERWPILKVAVPPAWNVWLGEVAVARGLSKAAVVRQCIRNLMVQRHEP